MIFEGRVFETQELVKKAFSDMEEWSQAQCLLDSRVFNRNKVEISRTDRVPPKKGWLKCDVGVAWNSRSMINGVSWILRDKKGEVLLHSRRSFVNVKSRVQANANGWLWAIDSLVSL